MTRLRVALGTILLAVLALPPGGAAAQAPPPPQAPEAVPAPAPAPEIPEAPPLPSPPVPDVFERRGTREAVRIGQDLNVPQGDALREALVVFGNATVAGQIDNGLVVVLGSVRLTGTAVIGGELVAVGGNVSAEPGAIVRRELVVVGGTLDAPDDFAPGGEHVVVGTGLLGDWFQGLVPYIARGLVWGRLIVPDLAWVWGVVAVFFLLYLALNVLFERPVFACTGTLRAKPLTAFGAGLLVLLLVGPVSLLLAASVIGLAVIPFLLCAVLAAWILGKVAVMRWIGTGVMDEDEPSSRAQATRSFVLGFVLITVAYLIPVLGIVTWAIVGVLGLGAASVTFFEAYRRETPQKRPLPPPPVVAPGSGVPPPPVPMPYGDPAGRAPASPPPAPAFDAAAAPASSPSTPAFDAAADSPPPRPPATPFPPPVPGAAVAAHPGGVPATAALVSMPKAIFRDRLAAFVLDVILVGIVVHMLAVEADEVFLPFLLVYHIGFWTWKQTTVGGMICQLRVTRVDGAPLTFADALVRGLSAIFSLAVLFIGALWILRDPDNQAWHDKIAGTYVVKVPKHWAL